MDVRRVDARDLRALRALVLRPGEPPGSLALHGEGDPRAAHFAVVEGGAVVACASVIPEGGEGAWRIRGVATREGHRGRGLGRRLVAACIAHAQAQGGRIAWLQATPDVAPWYEAQGFTREGVPYAMERGVRQRMVLALGAGARPPR